MQPKLKTNKNVTLEDLFSGLGRPTALKDAVSSTWVLAGLRLNVQALATFSFSFPHGNLTGGSDGKESACSAGDLGSIPRSRRSPGEGHGYPLQYSCLENSMDRGAWRASVHGIAKGQTQLSN